MQEETITYARGRLTELKDKKDELQRLIKDSKNLAIKNIQNDDLKGARLYIDKLELYFDELLKTNTDLNLLCNKWGFKWVKILSFLKAIRQKLWENFIVPFLFQAILTFLILSQKLEYEEFLTHQLNAYHTINYLKNNHFLDFESMDLESGKVKKAILKPKALELLKQDGLGVQLRKALSTGRDELIRSIVNRALEMSLKFMF